MEAFHKKGAAVIIKNCQIKSNKFSHKLEVLIKPYLKIEVSEVHFDVPDIATLGSDNIALKDLFKTEEY